MANKTYKINPKAGYNVMLRVDDTVSEDLKSKDKFVNAPFRLLSVGKSMISGKTNNVANFMCRPHGPDDKEGQVFVGDLFEGDNIYVVCPSVDTDEKWKMIVGTKKIPKGNIFREYNELQLNRLYDHIESNFKDCRKHGITPPHVLICFDDMSFSGSLKDKFHGVFAKIFCNGRHLRISTIVTAQKYSDILTTARENASAMMLFGCSHKQIRLISEDVNTLESDKAFRDLFQMTTKEKHEHMWVRFEDGLDPVKMYYYSTLKPVLAESGATNPS